MPPMALVVRRRAALLAVCAVRALSTSSDRLKQLGRHASIEIAPKQAATYAKLSNERPTAPRTVFVNFVETDEGHFAAVEEACATLKAAGLDPIPHVPASRVKNEPVKRLRALRDAGAASALIIAGNDWTDICARVDDVAACAAALLGLRPLFAGFPEGHPYVDRGSARLAEKLRAHGGSVVSQFCQDLPAHLAPWLDATRGDAEIIFVGVPGPAPRETLRRFYDLCGVGPSAAVEAAADEDSDGDVVAPTRDVDALAAYLEKHAVDDASVRLHLYPCGGVDRCLAYVERLCSGYSS